MNEEFETFPLDDAAIAAIAELNEQIKNARIAENAILSYFCKVHNLVGRIQLSENGRELLIQRAVAANGDLTLK